MADTIEITPLSAAANLREFVALLSYASSARITPDRQRRWQGDHHLLGLLDEEIRRRPLVTTVGDLSEEIVRECVDEVERVRYGEWKLDGDDGSAILGRLDQHFRPMQEQHVERRLEQELSVARHTQESAELEREVAHREYLAHRQLWGLPS